MATTVSAPIPSKSPSPQKRRPHRLHPARLLYLLLIAEIVGFAQNELQLLATAGPPALFDGDWDFEHLTNTWLGHLATSYPIPFIAALALSIPLAILGWFLDRQLSQSGEGLPPLIRVRDLKRQSFVKLGGDAAANFPYLTSPVERESSTAINAVEMASRGRGSKQGLLVLGEASAGKTRLAVETMLRVVPTWEVLRWREGYKLDWALTVASLPKRGLVLFLDDLQSYAAGTGGSPGEPARHELLPGTPAKTLETLVETLAQHVKHVVIVATCRAEDEEPTYQALWWLVDRLELVRLPRFSADPRDPAAAEIIIRFQQVKQEGPVHVEDWDGTIGSLVLGLTAKRGEYGELANLGLRGRDAQMVLQAMKLLYLARVTLYTARRVRAVCADIFEQAALRSSDRTWQAAVDELARRQFVSEVGAAGGQTDALEIRADRYFEKVVTAYPSSEHELDHDLARLVQVFEALQDADALLIQADALNLRQRFAEAVRIAQRARELAEQSDDHVALAHAFSLLATIETNENPDFGNLSLLEAAVKLVPLAPGGLNAGEAVLDVLWKRATLALRAQDWPAFDAAMAEIDQREFSQERRELQVPQYHGEALGWQGRWTEALPLFRQVRESAQRLGLRVPYCAATGWLGLALWHMGDEGTGRTYLLEALRIEHDELSSKEGVAKWLRLLSERYIGEGMFASALQMLLASRLLDRGHVLSARTDELIGQVRKALGEAEYDRLEAAFQPQDNELTRFAVVSGEG